jgi:hypothetical protein
MTATIAQKQFNPFIDYRKRTRPDIWHNVPKDEKRENLKALIYSFLMGGGQINRIVSKEKRGPGRHQSFAFKGQRKTKTSAALYNRYYSGDEIGGGHRFTSKPLSDPKPSRDDGAVVKIGSRIRRCDDQIDDKLSVPAEAELLSDQAINESRARDIKQGVKGDYTVSKKVDTGFENIAGKYDKATTRQVLPRWLEAA